MFDVDWSDPNRESVGDRRARKQKEKEVSDKGSSKDSADKDSKRDEQSSQASQASGSGSVRSSMSSVDKQFGFFGGKNRKKGRALGNSKSAASSTTGAPTILEQEPTEDNDNNIVESPAEVSSGVQQVSEAVNTGDHHHSVSEQPQSSKNLPRQHHPELPAHTTKPVVAGRLYFLHAPPLSSTINSHTLSLEQHIFESTNNVVGFSEAVFNTWNENHQGGSLLGYDMASPKPGLKSTLTQHLGDGISLITKTTEVKLQPRDKNDPDYLVSKVTLTAGSSGAEPKDVSAKQTPWQPPPQVTGVTHSLATVPESPSVSNLEEARHLVSMITDLSLTPAGNQTPAAGAEPKHGLKRKPKAPLKAPAIKPACQQYVGNPDLWKAPEVWEYSASEPEVSPVEEAVVPMGSEEINQLALDLASMQREANRMVEASPRTILLRLKAKWGERSVVATEDGTEKMQQDIDIADDQALMYKELEMDRKRWMLSALHHMETSIQTGTVISKPKVKPKVQKILSLFDSQAATSYLAISNPSIPIYHLSPDPLSHRRYPNIHPMTCPAISAAAVGVATEAFSAVNCLPIASILPSSDLPRLLQNIFRVLAPGGFLNMVIVDPLPSLGSAGPALRKWLDENLIFNLEQQFRCTNPSRNFPVWLLEAGLRAKGSVITTARFQAIIPPGDVGDGSSSSNSSSSSSGDDSEPATMRELRTTVGRMLWREIWGPFVGADKWWWEVPKIVEECVARDTCWEYSVIAACKESET